MSIVKRRFALYGVLPVAALASIIAYRARLEGPQAAPKRVLLLAGGADTYWGALVGGARAAAEKCGLELDVEGIVSQVAFTSTARNRQHDSMDACAGIIAATRLTAGDERLVVQLTGQLRLITIGEDSLPDRRLCHVGAASYSIGKIAAAAVQDACPGGGTILVLSPENASGAAREQALRHFIGSPAGDGAGAGSGARFRCVVARALAADSGVDQRAVARAIYGLARVDAVVDLCGSSAPRLIASMRRTAELAGARLITLDQSDAALAAVESGDAWAALVYDPYQAGYQAVAQLAVILRDGQIGTPVRGRGAINTAPRLVRRHEAAQFRAYGDSQATRPAA